MYWPWTYSAKVHLRHVCVVKNDDIAIRQIAYQEYKKPRQANLGNRDLIFSFIFLLLGMDLRYKK